MRATETGGRLIQLDVLRGVAILLVLGDHYATSIEPGRAGGFQALNAAMERFGWSGVDLFFVLSGFLVGGLLFSELKRNGHLDVKRFLVRRAFKIWPLYYAYIGALIVYYALSRHSLSVALDSWWPNLLHIQNYFFLKTPRGHTWSLAVEEHFYLALPLVLWLATSTSKGKTTASNSSAAATIPWVPRLALAVMLACAFARLWICLHDPRAVADPFSPMYSQTHLRVDSLFFGVLLAYWHHFEPHRLAFAAKSGGVLLLFGLCLVAPMIWISRASNLYLAALGYNLLYLGYGAILLAAIYVDVQSRGMLARFFRSFAARALALVGALSYPIYLWHLDLATFPLKALAKRFAFLPDEARWLLFALLNIALAVVGGWVWAKLLERPSLALRDRLFPRRAPAPLEALAQTQAPPTTGATPIP